MFKDKTFLIILAISAITHGVILMKYSGFNLPARNAKEQKAEISYLKPAQEETKQKKPLVKREPFLKLSPQLDIRKTPPPFLAEEGGTGKNKQAAIKDINFIKPAFTRPDIIAVKKKITLPAVELEKINNPSYISYYQLIREKIKRAAYQNYAGSETGEAYLSFIVSSDGYLQEVRLSQERSSPNPYLKEIALQSIKSASPFPDFPKELDYPQLSFNVIISFEVD